MMKYPHKPIVLSTSNQFSRQCPPPPPTPLWTANLGTHWHLELGKIISSFVFSIIALSIPGKISKAFLHAFSNPSITSGGERP